MTGAAIALVLVSALLHAAWNFFNKGSADRWAFFVAQGVLTCICYAPLVVWAWPRDGIDRMGWVWIIASAVTHAAYAVFLLKSYDAGDLSVAYPLSRTAPVLVAAWDIATARGQLTVGGVGGAVLAGIGALTLQLPALRTRGGRAVLGDKVTRYALMTTVFIAVFTVVDKQGVMHVPAFVYLYLLSLGEFSLIWVSLGRLGGQSRGTRAARQRAPRAVHGTRWPLLLSVDLVGARHSTGKLCPRLAPDQHRLRRHPRARLSRRR